MRKKKPATTNNQPRRLKNFLTRMFEGVVAVLLVLVFFSFFLYLLNSLFPTGKSLRALVARHETPAVAALSTGNDGGLSPKDLSAGALKTVAARLTWAHNRVKSKSSEAIAWGSAEEGRLLYDRDAIQTLDNSAAEITFDKNTVLDMGENSLVIIKSLTHDPMYREKRSFMVLVDGDLRGSLAAGGKDSVMLEIGTPGAMIRAKGGAGTDAPVDFKISINPDQTSTIAVYGGSAEVAAGGKTVLVGANQATVVGPDGQPIDPSTLPPPVRLTAPRSGATFAYRDLPPKVRFSWEKNASASGYHLVLARDPHFRDIVTDEQVNKSGFRHGNLKGGDYFWKVSSLTDSVEGLFSETGRFRVVEDQSPPSLNVRFPPKTLYSGRYTLRGKAEPGARVFVGGQRVSTTRSGNFEYKLKLKPGLNVIVVEAVDSVDNVAYRSKRVISKY
ncbi:MAG: hypothetical protein AMJ54_05630 [Deltaproteobacteria bacterium SG8_13]|nr:MAG: hypothetical protein AMJ54_05630 [Deltaproteobacteria bacterium SG8_13]